MEVTNAVMLGFNRSRHYFDGEVFAKGDVLTLSVEGMIKDLGNNQDRISPLISQELKRLYNDSTGLSGFNMQNLVEAPDIIINGINFGKGKILSIEAATSPDIHESKIQLSKYIFTVEFFYSLGSANFSIDGSNGWYAGLEGILEQYAHRIETFQENFDFTRTASGDETTTHSLDIKIRDDGSTKHTEYFVGGVCQDCLPIIGKSIPATPINIAGYIAWKIFNDNPQPAFPLHLGVSFNLADSNPELMKAPHDAFYTETINRVSGGCKYTKKWTRNTALPDDWPDAKVPVVSGDVHRFEVDGSQFTAKFVYSINKAIRGSTVVERADIFRVGGLRDGEGHRKIILKPGKVFEEVAKDSLARCQYALKDLIGIDETLHSINIDTKLFETPQEHRLGYETSYSSDPEIIDTYAGFKLDRRLNTQRSPDGVNTYTQESTLTPLKQATMSETSTGETFHDDGINQKDQINQYHHKKIEKLLDLLNGRFLPRADFLYSGGSISGTANTDAGWARYFVSAGLIDPEENLKIIKSDTKIKPITTSYRNQSGENLYTYRITSTQVWTDNEVIQNQWHASNPDDTTGSSSSADGRSWFTRKQVSVENNAPTRKKESYMIAGKGEVLHAAPQSNVGTLVINFNGTIIRDMSYNPLEKGQLTKKKPDWENLLKEARDECMVYFSSMRNPTLVFITDTQYTFGSDREFTMTITLTYTKAAETTKLETR